jgi:DNA-binding MarR family transcriptional regulator
MKGAPEQEAFVVLQRAASALMEELARLLKAQGVSPVQYNILRILRGVHPGALACGEVGNRLISREPDVTRLLDRMEKQGWVKRRRGKDDRRVVEVEITGSGLTLLKGLDGAVRELHRAQFARLGEQRTEKVARWLSALVES